MLLWYKEYSVRLEVREMTKKDRDGILQILNQILELELAGVVRYTHYSFMVFGYHRIPIVSWLRGQAEESIGHAHRAGELITQVGGHPSLKIGQLLETHQHDIGSILQESLEHEKKVVQCYRTLLDSSIAMKCVLLEEYARELIVAEEMHIGEVDKMLRNPGDIDTFADTDI